MILNSQHTGAGKDDPRFWYPEGGDGKLDGNLFNRWFSMNYNRLANDEDPKNSFFSATNNDFATEADAHTAFVGSPFNLAIPQGTARDNRVGDDVNIIKDQWKFVFSIPKFYPASDYWYANANVSNQRFVKIRCVGIMQTLLRPSGRVGYSVTNLFEDIGDIYSKFKYNGAKGYQVVYDQVKTIGLCSYNEDQQSAVRQHAHFTTNLAYLKRYTDSATNDVETNDTNPTTGCAKGAISWYFFIYDEGEELLTQGVDTVSTKSLRKVIKNPTVALIEVYRDTYFTDP